MAGKTPPLLTPEQRLLLTTIPADLPEEALRRYYTLGPEELIFIKRQHGSHNRLGIALQLCLLRFPGRVFTDFSTASGRVVAYVAEQLGVSPDVLNRYGQRPNTRSDHLTRLQEAFGYRTYDWSAMLDLTRHLLSPALESTAALPLIPETF